MTKKTDSQIISYPRKAMIEPTRSCNLKCPTCPVGNGSAKRFPDMTFSMYKKIIDNISNFIESLSLFNYGEPLLHPEIIRIIRYAKDSGIKIVKLHSNGLLLSDIMAKKLIKSGLDMIRISIDGTNQEIYSKYRIGGDFNELLNNINKLIEIRNKMDGNTLRIEAQCIVMSHNENNLLEFKHMFELIGVDYIRYKSFNAGMSWNLIKGVEFLPKTRSLSRYENKLATRLRKIYNPSTCPWPRKVLVINSDGTLVPCCYDYNNDNPLGNIEKVTFEEWWNTKQRIKFLNILANNYKEIAMCRNCHRGIMNIDIKNIKYAP